MIITTWMGHCSDCYGYYSRCLSFYFRPMMTPPGDPKNFRHRQYHAMPTSQHVWAVCGKRCRTTLLALGYTQLRPQLLLFSFGYYCSVAFAFLSFLCLKMPALMHASMGQDCSSSMSKGVH